MDTEASATLITHIIMYHFIGFHQMNGHVTVSLGIPVYHGDTSVMAWLDYVTQHQLMRLFAVKLILSYEQKCKVRSKFLKN